MSNSPFSSSGAEIWLDGDPVTLPPGRESIAAISAYLETLALGKHRVICSLVVDGEPVGFGTRAASARRRFMRIEAATLTLEQVPLQLLATALEQTEKARQQVEETIVLVLINESRVAREVWWKLARRLKEPLLTISLLPERVCGTPSGGASTLQLRRWQLEQLGAILQAVDEACHLESTEMLSNALEHRVLPWLRDLERLLSLWYQTVLVDLRTPRERGDDFVA